EHVLLLPEAKAPEIQPIVPQAWSEFKPGRRVRFKTLVHMEGQIITPVGLDGLMEISDDHGGTHHVEPEHVELLPDEKPVTAMSASSTERKITDDDILVHIP